MRKHKFVEGLKRYFSVEVSIEYKACLYFFAILFFGCVRRVLLGSVQMSILHMAEMIAAAYLMGYLQVYVLGNFDEAEHLGKRQVLFILLCTVLYTGASWVLGWFDRDVIPTLIFAGYMVFAYGCMFLVNKLKRNIDTENLNRMLTEYKRQG